LIKHVYPRQLKHNGISLYGHCIDGLLPQVAQPLAEVWHFEIGFTRSQELWQAYRRLRRHSSEPYVVTLHDTPGVVGRPFEQFIPSRNFFAKALRKSLDKTIGQHVIRRVVRGAAAVIVLNPLAKSALIERYDITPSRLFDSPLPVLTPLVGEGSKSPTERTAKSPLRLLFFGNVSERKGVDILLQACLKAQRQLGNWQLDVAGSFGGDREYELLLRNRIAKSALEKHVKLHGFVAEAILADLIAQADIIILPYDDPGIIHASGPLVTSLAAGKAVIATDIPIFVADIHDDRNGLLFPPGDIDALAAALTKLATDAPLRARLGHAARDTIRHSHDDSTIISSLNKAYGSLSKSMKARQ